MICSETALNSLSNIPVSINGNYGDSLQPSQWKDTLFKLESLHGSNHKGAIMIPTKYIISDEQLNIIAENFPNVWIFIAITGLNETKLFSLDEYLESYLKICSKLKNVVCAMRPIVEGQNDNLETLLPIMNTVKDGNRLLTYTGYRDPSIKGSQKFENENIFTEIEQFCKLNNITVERKCACMVSAVTNQPCHIHDDGVPQNIDLLKMLGYDLEVINNKVKILGFKNDFKISKGDVSFVQLLSKSKPLHNGYENSEILSINLKDNKKLVCTSSWFQWATQTSCRVGCWYCFADYKSDVRINLPNFGCNPKDILELIDFN